MRVPLSLLSSLVEPTGAYAGEASHGWNVEALVDRLVMTGTEIEAIHGTGPESMDGFVFGRVLTVEPHPDADRLRVCKVDTGEDEPRSIVCGAPNVAIDQLVPVALPGAVMPGGMKIKRAKLRGVPSEGMICSESELGISPESEGIMVIADLATEGAATSELRPGVPLAEHLPVSDTVLELEVTPNRSDCFGLYGIAREVAAITGGKLLDPPWSEDAEPAGDKPAADLASVTVEDLELCPRFTARVFTQVEVGPSPAWLKQALTAMGQRPINNVVDITNYVMLVTGQPLHAFDLDRVAGSGLIVRRARNGEKIETLDGIERGLDEKMVVVCDADGPAAIAGIMGGSGTEVTAETRRVLLEAANWNGPNILGSSRRLALRSEASSRFERQLHPVLCDRAQALASRLLVTHAGGVLAPGTIDVAAEMPEEPRIPFHLEDVRRLLGIEIPAKQARGYLEALGFKPTHHVFGWDGKGSAPPELVVAVPPDRHFDVTRPADLIEEIGRLHGYENLPATIPSLGAPGGLSRSQRLWRAAEDVLCHQGFDEVVGWSFTDPEESARLRLTDPAGTDEPKPGGESPSPIGIVNPLSVEQSVMRTTLLGSLLGAAAYNAAHGADRVALFESGRVYLPAPSPPTSTGESLSGDFPGQLPSFAQEPHRLAAVTFGPLRPAAWDGSSEVAGFFALKGVLEGLASRLGAALAFEPTGELGFLHPGRAATVTVRALHSSAATESDQPAAIGWIGEVHPSVAAEWDLDGDSVTAFELDLAPLIAASTAGEEIYQDVISFPAVRQDLALVVADELPAAAVQRAVLEAGSPLLRRAEIFDLYRGDQVSSGHKSLALRLEFQAADRTLTEGEVAALRDKIESAVESIGGSIRE